MSSYEIGSIVEGRVSGITSFGAFVSIDKGGTGLIHISQVSDGYVKDISSVLTVGQEISARVISYQIDAAGKEKISLSLKTVNGEKRAKKSFDSPPTQFTRDKPSAQTFDEMINKFKAVSDENNADARKNRQIKKQTNRKK